MVAVVPPGLAVPAGKAGVVVVAVAAARDFFSTVISVVAAWRPAAMGVAVAAEAMAGLEEKGARVMADHPMHWFASVPVLSPSSPN